MTQEVLDPRASSSEAIARRSLHDELVERLRGLIASGALAPGEKIQEMVLCKRFAVSRTPLREALKVLASEGIVTLQPHRGATVASLSVPELEEVFPVMGALEVTGGRDCLQPHHRSGDRGNYFASSEDGRALAPPRTPTVLQDQSGYPPGNPGGEPQRNLEVRLSGTGRSAADGALCREYVRRPLA